MIEQATICQVLGIQSLTASTHRSKLSSAVALQSKERAESGRRLRIPQSLLKSLDAHQCVATTKEEVGAQLSFRLVILSQTPGF
jgi:hypothetical protein